MISSSRNIYNDSHCELSRNFKHALPHQNILRCGLLCKTWLTFRDKHSTEKFTCKKIFLFILRFAEGERRNDKNKKK